MCACHSRLFSLLLMLQSVALCTSRVCAVYVNDQCNLHCLPELVSMFAFSYSLCCVFCNLISITSHCSKALEVLLTS